MQRLRAGWAAFVQAARDLWRRAHGGSVWRQRLLAGGAALIVLLLIAGVALASMAASATPQQRLATRTLPTATLTATATATITPTATLRPTATPTPKPVAKTPPPPPAPPPPPPTPPTPPPSSGGGIVVGDSLFSQFCATPTPSPVTPTPTATDTPTSAPTDTATATATGTSTGTATATATATATVSGTSTTLSGAGFVGLTMPTDCVPCPYVAGNNPSQAQIAGALANAAASYGLPVNLLKAVAWQESKWHEDVFSCDGGIGLMQVQYYVYGWLNGVSVPDCNIGATSDDPYSLQGNANLGAKYLKYLSCYYSFWGGYDEDANGNPHSLSNPSKYTVAWYYKNAGLPYPDSSNANSLCAAAFNANSYYPGLPSSTSDVWSCPYSATAGDNTLLDMTVSAYNAGPGVTDNGINNEWYVTGVEGYVAQFANGALPTSS